MENQIIFNLANRDLDELKQILTASKEEQLSNSITIRLALIKAKSLYKELEILSEKLDAAESVSMDENEYYIDDEGDPNMAVVNLEENNSENDINKLKEDSNTQVEPNVAISQEEVITEVNKEIIEEFEEDEVFETIDEDVYVDDDSEETISPSPDDKKVLGENFTNKMSINDKFTPSSPDQPVVAHKISDLKTAIGLNDRFLFTRELFDNNQEIYAETIEKLNSANNLEEAIVFLETNFHWTKNDASLKFIDLVNRRFQN